MHLTLNVRGKTSGFDMAEKMILLFVACVNLFTAMTESCDIFMCISDLLSKFPIKVSVFEMRFN